MTITAAMVKDLRAKTGAGIMDVKKALAENDGDIEASVDWLRAKGIAKAAKKAGRATAEGLVGVQVDGGTGVAVEVNSETDFVAKNERFRTMVNRIAKSAVHADDLASLRAADVDGGPMDDFVTEHISKLGENLTVSRMAKVTGDAVVSYVHNAAEPGMGKIGVLVAFSGDNSELARQIAMHVAATRPIALDENDVASDKIARERQILSEKARESGKPQNIIEKIVAGGLKKFFAEETLVNQKFVIDPNTTVGAAASAGGISIQGFVRLEVGEIAEQ